MPTTTDSRHGWRVVPNLARGLRSRHYDRGPLAPAALEGPVWDFYRYMNRTLGPGLTR